ncbi:MAG: DUF2190 family protein [Albimonas sp.]|uniref:DUF2190 family protein n=1 Tax=Albimonas sp. TaxID=1872425 RepID=UPI00405609F5
MKNYIQPGAMMSVTAPATVASGAGVLVGMLFGVAAADAASGASVEIATAGVFDLPKTSAQAWTAGAPIYWDPAEAEATSAADAGNVLIGCAAAAAANPSATGRVRLNGAVPAAAVPA